MNKMIVKCAVLLAVSIASGCAGQPKPTMVIRGQESATRSISEVTFDKSGVKLTLNEDCHRVDTEYWCNPPTRACSSKRKVIFKCGSAPMFALAPWGKEYEGTTASIPIPWKETGIDPLSAEAQRSLK